MSGSKHGFFRLVVKKKGESAYRIYLSSLFRIATHLGIAGELGACFTLPTGELRAIKFWATEAIASELQRQSLKQASNALRKGEHSRIIDCDTLTSASSLRQKSNSFKKPIKPLRGSSVIRVTRSRVFANKDYIAYGGSQSTIAARANVSKRTVQRRLDNQYRAKRNISAIKKVQVFRQVKDQDVVMRFIKHHRVDFVYDGPKKVFRFGSNAYEPLPNIYSSELVLCARRMQRFKFSLFCENKTVKSFRESKRVRD